MYIKEVLEYDWNYAEYIISDGIYELICMCESVPLPSGQTPKAGMRVSKLYAFAFDEINLLKVEENSLQEISIKKGKNHFEYTLQGKIVDKDKALICIGGLSISLEKDFDKGFPVCFKNGEIIKFFVDRIDCILDY